MIDDYCKRQIDELSFLGMERKSAPILHNGKYIEFTNGKILLNLSSNDYLGLVENTELKKRFFDKYPIEKLFMGSCSSRLLTGECKEMREIEERVCKLYNKEAALVFNSGYHANTGILAALCADKKSLIVADKLVHASIIDGIKLSGSKFERYRHCDYSHLEHLISTNINNYQYIFVVSDAVFSMDGDCTDLNALVSLKQKYPKIVLYIDEAHSFGVMGKLGLGLCEQIGVIDNIDIIVAPLGKAACSVGAFAVFGKNIKRFLINKMRPLIYSTALPQINFAWTNYILGQIPYLEQERNNLYHITNYTRELMTSYFKERTFNNVSSQIIPFLCKDAQECVKIYELLKEEGFYVPAIRPPTVASNSCRLRFSLTANMNKEEILVLCNKLKEKVYATI